MTKSSLILIIFFLLWLCPLGGAEESEPYTKVLDKLTSVEHFSDRPVLFIVGFDTSKSMSVEFDKSKKLTQTILSRYSAPTDSIYIFGFADKPSVLPATVQAKVISGSNPDSEIASVNESLLSLPRSSAKGTVFGRAKLFALEKLQEYSEKSNVIVLLFSDNNSEIEMGMNERETLKGLESSATSSSETIPLFSEGVSPLWLTIYTNSFPDTTPLAGPDGALDLDNPRLAWAARRVGSQTLEFVSPATERVEGDDIQVAVQFLGSSDPKSATLTVDGKDQKDTTFREGKATWTIGSLEPGSHLLFVQAVLSDGKVRTAEKEIHVAKSEPVMPSPIPATPEPASTQEQTEVPESTGSGIMPLVALVVLGILGAIAYFLSLKPAKIRVIGPDREESFLVPKGKSIRIGGKPRVESDLVFQTDHLKETIASVRCLSFGKAKVFTNNNLREGSMDVETDEGYSVGEQGEPLLTSATVTFADERDRKQIFTLVKEDASGPNSEDTEHFGGSTSGEETASDGGDWRS